VNESETAAALRRATRRAVFHLLKAGVESLRAVEAFVDELARVGHQGASDGDSEAPSRVRIDIE
jgi:hypothetical protein